MYRCSVELSVRYDELSQSEREHASLIDEYTFNSTANRFDLCFDLNTGFARVVKTLPDGTFSSIW